MKNLTYAKRVIENNMKSNGTISKIENRIAKHNKVANNLGFENAQKAFNSMGKSFLSLANA